MCKWRIVKVRKTREIESLEGLWLKYRYLLFSLKSDELLNENKWHCTIIRCNFSFLFIRHELITWPANNCQQKIICSCTMSLNCVRLQIIFCSCVNELNQAFFLSAIALAWKWKLPEDIHEKANSVIEWLNTYWTRLSQNIMICQCPVHQLFASSFGLGK